VHRDIKPSNVIFCEADRTFRLIDLGAMADLRTGVNYRPDESILDPYYCPPEQYCLPTDAPDLAKKSRVMSLAISGMLWNKHKPDRFDMYSIGLILLQLAMPHLRTKSALQARPRPRRARNWLPSGRIILQRVARAQTAPAPCFVA
jgi:serine/threonine protein kinase